MPAPCEQPARGAGRSTNATRQARSQGEESVQMHESPPFDGLSANRGGEIRTRDLLNPIQARYRAAPRPDAEICGLLRGSAGLQTANPGEIPPNLAHNVAHWCWKSPHVSEARRYVSGPGNATTWSLSVLSYPSHPLPFASGAHSSLTRSDSIGCVCWKAGSGGFRPESLYVPIFRVQTGVQWPVDTPRPAPRP